MRKTQILRALAGLSLATAACLSGCVAIESRQASAPGLRPNILVIVADDLGYSDLGAFGGEIETPNIDALVTQGRILTNFHTGATCSPTRAMLLSGADHHLVGLGQMAEITGVMTAFGSNPSLPPQVAQAYAPFGARNGDVVTFSSVPDGYVGYLNNKALSMPEVLRDNGYNTYMAGKWHLAMELMPNKTPPFWKVRKDALPNAKGFEKSFILNNGGGAHFAPAPGKLTPQDHVDYAENDVVMPSTALPPDFFSTDYFTDKLIAYIGARKDTPRKPFFAYAAYTAPHWPIQAPDDEIEAQRGKYDEGYEVIRARRIAKMKQLGILPKDFVPNAGLKSVAEGGTGRKRWSELTPAERAYQARLMEVYAAMVHRLDTNVGRLIQHLKDIGEYDNTLIVFMSDNGAEGTHFMPGTTNVDNSLGNLGKRLSMADYGERWAEVSAAPFRLWKAHTGAEGSNSVPAIIKMPRQDRTYPTLKALTHVTDILPTVLEMAGVNNPGTSYKGRTVYPISGVSLFPALSNPSSSANVRGPEAVLADELFFASFVRKGKWKLSRNSDIQDTATPRLFGSPHVPMSSLPWKLFDIEADRGEMNDLASQQPEVVADLLKEWGNYVKDNHVLIGNATISAPRNPLEP